ncbi:MAG: hypothetical protein WAO83_03240 [Fuerstiella sp.]
MCIGFTNPATTVRGMFRSAILLVVITVCRLAQAQETPATAPAPSDPLNSLRPGANLIYKDPDSNKITPLPAFSKEMLDDVLERVRLQAPIRLFDFIELKISGREEVNGFAYLTAELQVRVHVDKERVRIPVGFNDFKLSDRIDHVCDNKESWASLETSKLPAKSWILFGKGLHRLTFNLIGQVRTTTNGQQRIRIDTPVAPLSSLTLKFHELIESAQLTNGNPVDLRKATDAEVSEVQTWGLSKQTELVWTPKPTAEAQAITVRISSSAKLTLDMTTDPGSLSVRQPLMISGGSVDSLNVRLPTDFPEVLIDGQGAEGNSVVRSFDKTGESLWTVFFDDPITGPVTLNYDLGLGKKSYPQDISVALPDIENATNETGDIELVVPIGLNVKVNQPEEKNTRQIRVESSKGERTTVVAYRLLSSDSRLDLTVSERETRFFVAPHITFETERDQSRQGNNLFLTARFKVNIVDGLLNEMDLTWPGFTSDGWQIFGDTRLITDSKTIPITGYSPIDSPDKYTVVFPERQSGQFEIELQAFRDLDSVQAANGILFLPDIISPAPHTTTVSLIESDADSMVLRREGEETTFPALPYSRWPKVLKDSNKPLSAWLVGSPQEPIQIQITAQKSEVRVSVLTALSVVNDSIAVNQTISYDVRHEDLSEIQLILPLATPTVRLRETQELLFRTSTTSAGAVFSLPAPRRGKFDITVDYYWAPETTEPNSAGNLIKLPVASPTLQEKQFESSVVATNVPESLLLSASQSWRRIHRDDFTAAWQSDKPANTIPVILRHTLKNTSTKVPQFIVLNSTVVGRKLVTSVTGIFPEGTRAALFTATAQTKILNAFVNDRPAFFDRLSVDESDESLFQVRPKDDNPEPQVTQIKLVVEQPFDQQHHLFSICRPQLPGFAGAESRKCNAIWVLSQTSDQSVFDLGEGMTQLGGGVVDRITGDFSSVESSISSLLSPYDATVQDIATGLVSKATASSERFEISAGSVYSEDHSIVVVSRRVVFLASAVLSLLLYITVLKFTARQLTVAVFAATLLLAVIVSVTPTTVHLLLVQLIPASCIAATAAFIRRTYLKRRTSLIPSPIDSEGSTVFAVDQPSPVSEITTLSISQA